SILCFRDFRPRLLRRRACPRAARSADPWARNDGVDRPLPGSMCQSWVAKDQLEGEPSMNEVSTIGLDIAKNVFQVHGVDRTGAVAIRRALRRSQMLAWFAKLPPCLVGMEACG